MIKRDALKILKVLSRGYPIVGITGPRQSGKTTLAKMAFAKKKYVSLETPSTLDFALNDPKEFLFSIKDGAIIDEVQNAPKLFSYLQEIVDDKNTNGQFILTGSQQFGLLSGITQSLAGRVGLLELLPLSISELKDKKLSLAKQMLKGFYPRLYSSRTSYKLWYEDYIKTYIEKDVRKLVNIKNLRQFRTFLRLCAARNGQLLNISELCEAADINFKTANSWLSVLEASYIIYFLEPHFKNFSKRLVKSPKLYFYDVGLLCYLLGLKSEEEFFLNPYKGHLFEAMVISELKKYNMNHREGHNFYFWRDSKGVEVDVLFETGRKVRIVEIKSGATIQSVFFKNLAVYKEYAGSYIDKSFLVYGGKESQRRSDFSVLPWDLSNRVFK